MKTIGVYTNLSKDPNLVITKRIVSALKACSVSPMVMDELAEPLGLRGCSEDEFFAGVEILIVAGGDGTVLRIAPRVMAAQIPVLGINLGRIGFLTEVEISEIDRAVKRVLDGDYSVERRMMLRASWGENVKYALNEMAIQRYQYSRMIRFGIWINGVESDSFSADGVIVASPTGSTAYSLSAGGPILSPRVEAMVITPICAHTMHSKPIVIAPDEVVTIRPLTGECYGVADGFDVSPVVGEIVIRRAERDALFLRFEEKNFYNGLKSKLIEWNET